MTRAAQKKIAGIVLAAGISSRMGKTKQLLPFKGSTLLGTVLENALASDLDSLVVVLGHEAENIQIRLSRQMAHQKVRITLNTDYLSGQSSSIAAGVTALEKDADAAMFLLSDQPLIRTRTINRLIKAYSESNHKIVIPSCQGQRGNPVIFNRLLFRELEQLKNDTGARVLFKKHAADLLLFPVHDSAILTDIDTPDDYRRCREDDL